MARLRESYKNDVFPALMEQFKYTNVMEVPKLEKVTINMGLGEAKENAKIMESAIEEISLITGQRPVVTREKKIHSQLQGETGNACRSQGHPQGRKHVRFHRQVVQHRSSESKRLQGREQELL